MFELDKQLARDTIELGQFKLSKVLLMNDSRYPWVILVPQKPNLHEIYHLTPEDQQQLTMESSFVSQRLADAYKAESMNVAALGNVVRQLHVHHVVRSSSDDVWPAPVWGNGQAKQYSEQQLKEQLEKLKMLFSDYWQDADIQDKPMY